MRSQVAAIQGLQKKIAVAITGGGTELIGELLRYGGSSSTIVDCQIPYSNEALQEYVGHDIKKACSQETSKSMAMVALMKAAAISKTPEVSVGIGITASLAKQNQREGRDNVAYLSVQTCHASLYEKFTFSPVMSRLEQEGELVRLLLKILPSYIYAASQENKFSIAPTLGDDKAIYIPVNSEEKSNFVYPGSFNPLHDGHMAIINHGARRDANKTKTVDLEISIRNVDKPLLDYNDIIGRVVQFYGYDQIGGVYITNMPTFYDKACYFKDVKFMVGMDTLQRICDIRYYPEFTYISDATSRLRTKMTANKSKFLAYERPSVGNILASSFRAYVDVDSAKNFTPVDISSTQLRKSV